MPRKKRVSQTNMCHHVILRGIDRRPTFIDDEDRSRFCLLMQEASELCLFRIHAFCLMTNHIHLILEPTKGLLSTGVHRFSSRYAQHFNKRHKRSGYVFQGRFRSILVEDGCYLRRLVRYIHLNPVKAKMKRHPEQYQWSSYNAYFDRSTYTWLSMGRVLSYFGDVRSEALAAMAVHLDAKMDAELDSQQIVKAFRSGIYGSEEFSEIYKDNNGNIPDTVVEYDLVNNIEQLIEAIGKHFNVRLEELRSTEKRRELVHARATLARAVQLCRGLELGDICKILDKHHGTVSRLAAAARKNHLLDELANRIVEGLSH